MSNDNTNADDSSKMNLDNSNSSSKVVSTSDLKKDVDNAIKDIQSNGKNDGSNDDNKDDNAILSILTSLQQILNSITDANGNIKAQITDNQNLSQSMASNLLALQNDLNKLAQFENNLGNSSKASLAASGLNSNELLNIANEIGSLAQNLEPISANTSTLGGILESLGLSDLATNNSIGEASDDNINTTSKTSANLNGSSEGDLIKNIENDLKSILQTLNSSSSKTSVDSSADINNQINMINDEIKTIDNSKSSSSQNLSNGNSSSENSANTDKSSEVLNKIIGNDGEDSQQYSKVINMANQVLNNTNTVSKAEAAPQEPEVRSSNFTEDIIKSMKYMEDNDVKNMTLKIQPKELGEVIISVTADRSGLMTANITASTKEAYNILNSNFNSIGNEISNQMVKIQSVNINIYNGDTTYFKDGSQNNGNSENNGKSKRHHNGLSSSSDNLEDDDNGPSSIYSSGEVDALA